MIDKNELFREIDKNRDSIIELGDRLFECPELGFKEFKTAEIIKGELDSLGIKYKSEIGITGVKAEMGNGSYNIGIVSDMDALPSKNVSGQIHSCGHSIQTSIALATAKILSRTNLLEGTDVKVNLIFAPAEEFIDFEYRDKLIGEGKILYRSGKQHMIAEGYFDDVDCVLSAHANGDREAKFDINSTLAGFMAKKAVFIGQAAHSGAAPHLGRNTLQGAVLCETAIAFIKDRFEPSYGVKINPVITEPGGTINIIPDRTVMETYVRANDADTLMYACQCVDRCIEHCARAMELDYEITNTKGYMPLKQSTALNSVVKENMLLLCNEGDIVDNVVSGASGDIGDVSCILPTIQFGFSGIEGIFHSDNFKIADKENCYINTVKIMCGTILDLIENKALRVKGI
ncbi:hippurate hydrolase [Clostridiales bacterium]|nr:hippurate hydrolase [Clostridiales bacterium]